MKAQGIEAAFERLDERVDDPAQRHVVSLLAGLQQQLEYAAAKQSPFKSWWRRAKRPPIRGLYLWGGVGRGKTFLMDLFFSTLDIEKKKRVHFHRMMNAIHAELRTLDGVEDPLNVVAERLAAEANLLCFDEFFVSDIGDAMILGRLLEGLFSRGVTLVATSNSPPSELYRDGLQRARFLPAIRMLETHTAVVELDGGRDYRLRLLEQAGTFIPAGGGDVNERLLSFFRRVASGDSEEGRVIELLGRPIRTVRSGRGVAWFEFAELCGGPRSAADYVELAQLCHTVILSSVPVLDASRDDEARRFIALVDELYDRRVKLILSAAAPIESLYRGKRLAFEFERTRSRLTEMQSTDYLGSAHAA